MKYLNTFVTVVRNKAGYFFVVFFIGSIFGFITTRFSYFNFEKDINIIDFTTLVVSTVVGIYIATSVQKSVAVQKSEKDLIIGEINQIKISLNTISNSVVQNNLPFNDTLFKFKIIITSIYDLQQLTLACNINVSEQINEVKNKAIEIKQLITNISPNTENQKIDVSSIQNRCNILFSDLTLNLLKLIIHINKY